ncbi:hypothetical protein [Streptomyces chartreusis]
MARDEWTEVPALSSGKRCGVQWTPWMGDFFTSWSPRNSNNNAEGPWDHWVDLALKILSDPMTAIVRPDAHRAVQDLTPCDFYDEARRELTEAELNERFGS